MQAARPVDGNVALLAVESRSALHRAAGADAAELEEAVEDGTVVADIVFSLLAHVGVHIVRRHLGQEVDVLVRVELRHLGKHGWFRALSRTS